MISYRTIESRIPYADSTYVEIPYAEIAYAHLIYLIWNAMKQRFILSHNDNSKDN